VKLAHKFSIYANRGSIIPTYKYKRRTHPDWHTPDDTPLGIPYDRRRRDCHWKVTCNYASAAGDQIPFLWNPVKLDLLFLFFFVTAYPLW